MQVQDIIKDKLIASTESSVPKMTKRHKEAPTISNKAIVAIGMRRTGKTTWLHQCQQKYLDQGYAKADLIFFNFEDERLADLQATQLQLILDIQERLYPNESGIKRVLFFDEIQLVNNWEQFIRRLLDVYLWFTRSSLKGLLKVY